MYVHVITICRVIVPLDGGLMTERLGKLRHGPLCFIDPEAGSALRHECLALPAHHVAEGTIAALIAAHATIRTEILQIGLHCAARLERSASDCCSDRYLLLDRQRALASLVTVWSVLPGNVKHNLITVSLDRYGEITAAFNAERTVILIAVESIRPTGIVSLKKKNMGEYIRIGETNTMKAIVLSFLTWASSIPPKSVSLGFLSM